MLRGTWCVLVPHLLMLNSYAPFSEFQIVCLVIANCASNASKFIILFGGYDRYLIVFLQLDAPLRFVKKLA